MGSIGQAIYLLDKAIFAWLRTTFGSETLDNVLVYIGNFYFWTPLLIFLAVVLYTSRGKGAALNLLYGVGTVVLSYQAGFLLSYLFKQPAPYVIEHILHSNTLPAFQNEYSYSFPDWPTAAICSAIAFCRHRVRSAGAYFPQGLMFLVWIMAFSRVYSGYAYPYDILAGWLLGLGIAFLLRMLAQNMDLVIKAPQAVSSTEEHKREA